MFTTKIDNQILELSHKLIQHPTKDVYQNHIHEYCEILLFIKGNANYNIDGQIFTLTPYDMLFIPAGAYHYLSPTETSEYENYVIGLPLSMIDPLHYDCLFSQPLMVNIKNHTELFNFFTRLDYYHDTFSEEDFSKSARALVNELIVYLSYCKKELNYVHSSSVAQIDEIIRYISANIEKPLNADIIARHFLLSKSYIQNIFSQNMHIGLKKYIIQKKLYAADTDIKRGLSPYIACEKYYFGDYSSFFRQYKTHFKKSPSKKTDNC